MHRLPSTQSSVRISKFIVGLALGVLVGAAPTSASADEGSDALAPASGVEISNTEATGCACGTAHQRGVHPAAMLVLGLGLLTRRRR